MYLGLDIGTSGVKAVLMDGDQVILASAHADLTVSRPYPGWSEQAPDDWWRAVETALDQLKSTHGAALSAVTGIGLSGQMHGATLLDADDRPLRPALLWNDGRASAECAHLGARADFEGTTGNILMAGFTAPKVEWVRTHEPDVFAATRTILLPKDYVRLRLTGDKASDMSDSSGTSWLDVAARSWSSALLEASRLTDAHMPALFEGTAPTGTLRPALASRWGMSGAPVVAGGGGDNAASACGMGTLSSGSAFASIGTSGVLFVSNAAFLPNTAGAVHAFCHAVPETWHQMGVILSAADSLTWLSEITGRSAADLTGQLTGRIDGPGRLTFLPYLSGERTPINDAGARGSFVGLDRSASVEDLTQAVLEGVAFAFADSRDVLRAAGTTFDSVTAIGGGARSDVWLQIMANALDMPVHVPEDGDFGAAFGAARLGMVAATGADPAAICTPPAIAHTVLPKQVDDYATAHARYKALYPAIKEVS
ncbi:MAG: xylulokinase [Pseudomonadota bacterium]